MNNTSNNNIKSPTDPRLRRTSPSVSTSTASTSSSCEPHHHHHHQEEDGEISHTGSAQQQEKTKIINVDDGKQKTKRVGKVPCKYYMQGKCSKGDQCTFSHMYEPERTPDAVRQEHERILGLPGDVLVDLAGKNGQTIWQVLTAGVCKYILHAKGCTRQENCLYSHDVHKLPCRFYHAWGRCASGDTCRFSHAEIKSQLLKDRIRQEAREAVKLERERERQGDDDNFGRRKMVKKSEDPHVDHQVSQSDSNRIVEQDDDEVMRQLNPFAF